MWNPILFSILGVLLHLLEAMAMAIKAYARMDDVRIQNMVVDIPPHKENVWVKLNIN